MDEGDIKSRIDNIPITAIPLAIDQLFNNAKAKQHDSYCDAIIGVSKIINYPARYEDKIIQQMTQDFAEFYNWFKSQHIENKKVRYRLQLMNYGFFWENAAVHRLLTSLVEIACVGSYTEPLLGQTEHRTNSIYEKLISDTSKASLDIASVIEALYNNQIRNATVHAQLYFFEKGITLMNHKDNLKNTIPSISFDVWDALYVKTAVFIEVLFRKRLSEIKVISS
jgi:hypothetical protein